MFSVYPKSRSFLKKIIVQHRKRCAVFFVTIIIQSFFNLLLPYIAKIETDQLIGQSETLYFLTSSPYGIFLIIVAIWFIIETAEKVIKTLLHLLQKSYEQIFESNYFLALYNRLKYIELGVYSNKKNQDLFSRILGEDRILNDLFEQIWDYLSLILFVVWSFSLLHWLDRKITVWLMLWGLSYYLLYLRERKMDVRKRFDSWELERSMRSTKWMAETEYHKLVAIGASWLVLDTIHEYNTKHRTISQTYEKKRELIWWIRTTIDNVINYWIKIIIARSIFQATASVWYMTMTIALLQKLSGFIENLVNSKRRYEQTKEKMAMLELYLDATDHTDTKKQFTNWDFNDIQINNLCFSYPNFTEYELKYFDIMLQKLNMNKQNAEYQLDKIHAIQEAKKNAEIIPPKVLIDITMHFTKWTIYGIVWKNWAWKTTLIHILMSYFKSYLWSIKWWNYDHKTMPFEHFEKSIAVIEQEPFLLRWFTLRQNLLVWVEKQYSDKELYDLLDIFWLWTIIRWFRKWLDTIYTYDCNFSWWQNQLLSLLRVYLQDKPVIILDEWTNQLDAENESKIMNFLLKNKRDKIIIMVSHRMTTLQKADYLYCLEDWSITDQGTPSALRKKDSLFTKFWKEQVE